MAVHAGRVLDLLHRVEAGRRPGPLNDLHASPKHVQELLRFVALLLARRAARSTQIIAQIDRMNGRTGSLVKRRFVADPEVDFPVDLAGVVLKRVQDDVAVALVEFSGVRASSIWLG